MGSLLLYLHSPRTPSFQASGGLPLPAPRGTPHPSALSSRLPIALSSPGPHCVPHIRPAVLSHECLLNDCVMVIICFSHVSLSPNKIGQLGGPSEACIEPKSQQATHIFFFFFGKQSRTPENNISQLRCFNNNIPDSFLTNSCTRRKLWGWDAGRGAVCPGVSASGKCWLSSPPVGLASERPSGFCSKGLCQTVHTLSSLGGTRLLETMAFIFFNFYGVLLLPPGLLLSL